MTGPAPTPNRTMLERTARTIRPLLNDVVFVGGHVAELLITDPAAVRLRPTQDVDVIVDITTRAAYYRLAERLSALGFGPDPREGAPTCRMRSRDGLVLDVMPLTADVLGFTNPWYGYTIDTATAVRLADDLAIRAATAPAFLATKWAAFAGRGGGDILTSRDVEDVITVVAGRPAVASEVRAARGDVRAWLATSTRAFLEEPWAPDVIAGTLPDAYVSPAVVARVADRLRDIAEG